MRWELPPMGAAVQDKTVREELPSLFIHDSLRAQSCFVSPSHLPTTTVETTRSSLPDWTVTWRLKMLVPWWDLGSQNYTSCCHSFVLTHRIQCSRESAERSPMAPTGRCWLGREGHESGGELAQSPERDPRLREADVGSRVVPV